MGGVTISSTGITAGSPLMVAFSKAGGMDGGAMKGGGVAGVAVNPVTVAFSMTLPLMRICEWAKREQFQNSECNIQSAKPMGS